MTSKSELAKENEKTREVKEREDNVKEKGKEIVHDTKKKIEEISSKTEDLEIKDVPDLLPSVERIDQKLKGAKDAIGEARNAQLGDTDLNRYPKIQQVMKDTQKIIDDERGMVKAMNKDGTLGDTIQDTANFASLIKDQSVITLDKLWTNWAGLLTVVAGTSAGSWKQILQESGHLLNQLNYTQDFVKLLSDLQQTLWALSRRAAKDEPIGEKLAEVNAEWEKQRTQLLEDWKKIWAVLNESPMWKQLIAKGKALKNTAAKTLEETKEKAEEAAEEVKDSEETKKLKQDFKNILQLIVGKDGPDVQEFLDYCSYAYSDIIENEDYSTWASEMSECFECLSSTENKSSAEYQKAMEKMQEQTKKILDETVNNHNLKCALRESRKLLKSAKNDPNTKKLLADSNKLLRHISDKKGVNILDPQLLNEIRAVLVPLVMDHLDNTPLPDFHGKDSNALGTYDYQLSGIRLATSGLIPDKIKIEFRYQAEANPSQLKMNYQHMYMYLEASDIQVSFKDVKWHYNRHTIPRFSDNGTIDFATAGKGIQLRIKAELHDYKAPDHAHSLGELLADPKDKKMFTILRAECIIDDFHVRVSDSGAANVFYEMLAGIWGTKIKHQIESLIEYKMNLLAQKFDAQLYDTCRRATQPSLAEETKDAILSAGQAAGESIKETAAEVKKTIQSL